MATLCSMQIHEPGVEVSISYLESNKKLTSADWVLSAGTRAEIWVWLNENLVYNKIAIGPDTGSENLPGNHTAVWVEEYQAYDLPPEITYRFNIESVAGT